MLPRTLLASGLLLATLAFSVFHVPPRATAAAMLTHTTLHAEARAGDSAQPLPVDRPFFQGSFPDEETAVTVAAIVRWIESRGCEYHCRKCGNPEYHDIVIASYDSYEASHLETCNIGTCCSHAYCCDPQQGFCPPPADCGDSLAGEWEHLTDIAASLSTAGELSDLLALFQGWAALNHERMAVQVGHPCRDGEILAHLPVSEAALVVTARLP